MRSDLHWSVIGREIYAYLSDRFYYFHVSAGRASRSDSLWINHGDVSDADLYHCDYREYAAGSVHLLFRQKDIGVGRGETRHRRFLLLVPDEGREGREQKLQAKAGRGLFVALLLFVGIPLPGTGAWTGTLAASLLDMDFKSSVLACMGGVLLAGVIMALASTGVLGAFGALAA